MIRKYEKENLYRFFFPFMAGLSLLYRLTPTWVRFQPIIGKTSYFVYAVMAVTALVIMIRHYRYDDFYLWLALFLGFRVFTTVINGQEVAWVALSSVMCWSMVVILCFGYSVDRKGTLGGLCLLSLAFLLLNLCDILQRHGVIPGLFFNTAFIENHNSYILFFMIAIAASYLLMEEEQNAFWAVIWLGIFIVVCLTYYYERSITSMMGLMLLYIYLLLLNRRFTRGFLNIKTYVIILAVFFFGFVCGGIRGGLSARVLEVLGKNPDLSGRTMIWRDYLTMCGKSPVLGYGVLREEALSNVMYGTYSRFDTSAHNIILNLVFQTGGVGIFFLFMLFYSTVKKFAFIKKERIRFFFEAFLGIMLLMSMFEAYSIEIYLIIITVMYLVTECDRRGERE